MAGSVLRAVHSISEPSNQRALFRSNKAYIHGDLMMDATSHSLVSHYDHPNCYTTESALISGRKRSFYILLSLLFLGILFLLLIAIGSVVVYVSYNNRVRIKAPAYRKDSCQSIRCHFGADCVFDEDGREPYCRCVPQCSPGKELVCGSDNVTYASACHLKMASCELQTEIVAKHEGPCSSTQSRCTQSDCKFGAVCTQSSGGGSECKCPDRCLDYKEAVEYLKSWQHSSDDQLTDQHPVCGDDGHQYESICQLVRVACERKKTILVKYVGFCDPCKGQVCPFNQTCQLDDDRRPFCSCNQNCSNEFDDRDSPLCGSDGKLYANECALRRQSCLSGVQLARMETSYCSQGNHPCNKLDCNYNGICLVDKVGVARCECRTCQAIYAPVCGSDGVTYDSECHLRRESCLKKVNISVVYETKCDQKALQIASSGGEQFSGQCSPDNCHFGGVCVVERPLGGQPRSVCQCVKCTKEENPICGSNGKTYANDCEMQFEACKNQRPIYISHKGPCKKCDQSKCKYYAICEANQYGIHECVCPQVCIRMDAPVCGANGVTYENECDLRVRACRAQMAIPVAHLGPCDDCQTINCQNGAHCENGRCVCPTSCAESVYEPICANDGQTYRNECEMRKNACNNDIDLRKLFYGQCEENEKDPDE